MSTPKKKKPSTKASKKAAKPPAITETIQAPHVFIPEETATLSAHLREILDQIEAHEGEAKAAAQDFKLRVTNLKNESKMIRTKLASGQETRALEVIVEFKPKDRRKVYLHPKSKAVIREEPMTEVDWQLPMFKPAADGKGEVVVAPAKADKPPKKEKAPDKGAEKTKVSETDPQHGKTPLAGKMNAAASVSDAPKVVADIVFLETLDHATLTRHFKKCAKEAGWSEVQIGAIKDLLRDQDTEKGMLDVLRPHIVAPAEAAQ